MVLLLSEILFYVTRIHSLQAATQNSVSLVQVGESYAAPGYNASVSQMDFVQLVRM